MTPLNAYPSGDAHGTLTKRTRDFLLEQIRVGAIKPGQHIPSVRDLSKNLQVSTKVAFLAIKELKDQRILERLSNGRHLVGKNVSWVQQKRSLRLGFSSCGSEHIRHGVYQSIFNHLTRMGKDSSTTVDCLLELHDTWSGLEREHYDAMIVADWKPGNTAAICKGLCIGLDTWEGIDVDCVVKTDHFKGGELAGQHLRERGRQRVVYWDVVKEKGLLLKGMIHRRLGFLKGWVDGGGDMDHVKHLPVVLGTEDLRTLVAEHVRGADAFFAYCDSEAIRIMDLLSEMGIRVPEDIAVVGFDGTYEAMKHTPSLTTVRQPCREIAEKVFELVSGFDGQKAGIRDQEFLIAPVLCPGGST